MGKPKQRRLAAKPTSLDGTLSNKDFDGEDSWVIVKQQRITILIPALPHARKSIMPKPRPIKPETMPTKAVDNKSAAAIETSNMVATIGEREKVTSAAPNKGTKMSTQVPTLQVMAIQKLPRVHIELESRDPNRVHTYKSPNMRPISNLSKTITRQRMLHGQGRFLDGSLLLNQALRASLLEKKLQKAGGLSRWLASMGLGQFVKIFQGKRVGKFQLVNLTMKKLKDMGADAVGPRRKLMHAIDCICQPYCFEAC